MEAMALFPLHRRPPRRDLSDRWSGMLRGAAVAVVLLGTVGSVLVSRGWDTTVDRQRDERLDRTKTSRTASIELALGDYEKALRAARSLWLASGRWTRRSSRSSCGVSTGRPAIRVCRTSAGARWSGGTRRPATKPPPAPRITRTS